MFDTAKVWWVILTQLGSLSASSRYSEMWIRHFVAEALENEGVLDYLREPRNYGQIIARFGFVDCPYTREVLETLASGKRNILAKEGERYRRDLSVPLLTLEQVKERTPDKFHGMTMWQDFARRIPGRMRQEPMDFVHRFEEEGPAIFSFDQSLTRKVFAVLRRAAFAYVDTRAFRGKRLLDVACGSGHETADIWLWLKGDVQITAVDPVAGLVALAEQNFARLVAEGRDNTVVPLTEENRPSFHVMSAMDLDLEDESYDVIFHSLLLHWTPDPARTVQEVGRVLKPGGVVFGTQICKPTASPYMNLITQVHENVYGYFWEEEFRRWYAQAGVTLEMATPAGVFKGRKRN